MSWKAEYIILIIISTVIDYTAGLAIYNTNKKLKKKLFLFLSLMTNLGLLFSFKYFNFFNDSVRELLGRFTIQLDPFTLKVLLPVGISFYTFQTLSYTIDIYRGKIRPEKHFGIFAVYVSFFPQLVAGPIERAKNLLPQFFEKHKFKYDRVTDGLKLMMWGFFKKVVIADRLAFLVDQIFNNPADYSGLPLIIGTVFFAYQIYCDFSGYSDIAIGAAQVMGFRLMDNFRRPYFARSINEFWQRWHISLSTWFRDYLYIPLGGNRVSRSRWIYNIMVVFLLSGLWHGANWTFIVWGGLHGMYYVISRLTAGFRRRLVNLTRLDRFPFLHRLVQMAIVFTLVNLGWIFFRANSISDAIYILTHLFSGLTFDVFHIYIGLDFIDLMIAVFSICFLEFIHLIQEHVRMRQFLKDKPRPIRWSIYISILLMILVFGVFGAKQFIYFQF
jgi:D-alanyl-lipoteichoic acid acyltransferase DltB (MBOAT superfamily)